MKLSELEMTEISMDAKAVLKWYNGLNPRYVDLVSDYAGREVFLVEGDAMLLDCFADGLIDFQGKFLSPSRSTAKRKTALLL